jgi:hypothetical protein
MTFVFSSFFINTSPQYKDKPEKQAKEVYCQKAGPARGEDNPYFRRRKEKQTYPAKNINVNRSDSERKDGSRKKQQEPEGTV